MELYKNTEWKKVAIGNEYINIPLDVERETLIKLITKIKDGTHDSFKDAKDSDAKLLLSAKNIKNSQLVFGNNERKISKGDYEKIIKNGFPQKGDLLFTIVGTIGESMIWDKEHPEAFQRSVSFIRVNEKLNNKYLDYYLKFSLAKNEISKKTKVGAQPGIYLNDLKSLDILIYSITEQKAIASLLSSQESIIQKTKNLIANIEKRNQFMMDELLSGRLRVKEENGQPVFYRNPDENWNEVKINGEDVNIPKDWDSFKLKGNIDIKTGKKDANVAKKDGKYAFFTCGKQILKTDTYDFDCEAVLIAGNGDVGDTKYYQGKFDAYQRTYVLSKYKYDLKFLFIYMKKLFKDSIDALGSAMPYIKLGYLENFSVNQPQNLNERELLLKVITSLNDEKEKYEKILEKEEKTFTFLLEELMSGRLRIKI